MVMSEEVSPDQTVEQADSEEANLMIADPDDYQKTKKLKAISDAKSHVMELKRNRSERIQELSNQFRSTGVEVFQNEIATAVADYGTELLPLIEEALEKEVIEKADLELEGSEWGTDVPVIEFITCNGEMAEKEGPTHLQTSMSVYRQLQRIERELGLGLDLEEELSPAEI